MARGGKREGAGRKKRFTFEKKLALANEVTLLQQQQPGLSVVEALENLQGRGLITPQTKQRYLTPEYFEQEMLSILKENEREGILTRLPRLSQEDPL